MSDSKPSESNPSEESDVFNLDKIRSLIELMKEHDLSQIDLREGEQRVKLQRGPDGMPMMVSAPSAPAPAPTPAAASAGASEAAASNPNHVEIKSPMPGTFYEAANPESAAFVKVGDSVSADTTVCIIEAMKTFSQVPAEISGKVIAILAKNGDAVEFDTPLFRVDTSQ